MKILMFAPDRTNSTDGVIIAGMHNIMKSVFGEYECDYLLFDTHQVLTEEELNPNIKYDLIVIAGTPWIWDLFNRSAKWKNLEKCFEIHSYAKKLFFGIGSCLFKEFEFDDYILGREEEIDALKKIYSQATVIVRDSIAFNKLKKNNIDCNLLVCPSFFCYGLNPITPKKSTTNVLIWYDPTNGLSFQGWGNKDKLDNYININTEFYKKYNPVVYTHLEKEIPLAEKIGLPTPKLIGGWQNTLTIMEDANFVLSGRVHCSVPAFVQGKPVGLLEIDSRARVIGDFGGTIINSINQFNTMGYQYRDFTLHLKEYMRLLNNL